MSKKTYLSTIDQDVAGEILADLEVMSTKEVASKYFEKLGKKESTLYSILLREKKRQIGKMPDEKVELSVEDERLLEDYRSGKVDFDAIQKEVSVRMFKRLLSGDIDIKTRDWLQSESLKMRKNASEKQKDAMEIFIDTLFSGILPSPVCPHCHQPTSIRLEELGATIQGTDL